MKIVKTKTIKNMLFVIVDDFSSKEETKSLAKLLATITDDKITMFSISKKDEHIIDGSIFDRKDLL